MAMPGGVCAWTIEVPWTKVRGAFCMGMCAQADASAE